jgi:LmbE family N-acetylglucosaminyl deacetylase
MNSALKDIFRFGRMLYLRCHFRRNAKELPSFSRPMIIAPHPDDEAFGCGGLILRTISEGGEPSVVFLTDGESSLKSFGADGKLTVDHRRELTVRAAGQLGLKTGNTRWLHLPDGGLPKNSEPLFQEAVQKLLTTIQQFKPDAIFVTHPLDAWSDHIAASELVHEAVSRSETPAELWFYAVWLWYSMKACKVSELGPGRLHLLSIRPWIRQKKTALGIYVNEKSTEGHPWSGYLPALFIKAFDWPYEVFEKVEIKQ